MAGPDSSYSSFEIHICWNVDSDAKIEPPIHTEYLRSGGAMILIFIVDGANATQQRERERERERMIVKIHSAINQINQINQSNQSINLTRQLLLHSVGNAREHRRTARQHRVAVEILANVDVALHDRVVRRLVNAGRLHAQERRLKQRLRTAESLVANRNHLAVWQLIAIVACVHVCLLKLVDSNHGFWFSNKQAQEFNR